MNKLSIPFFLPPCGLLLPNFCPEIYAIFVIGEQKSVLAKQPCMRFVTGDENAKGQKRDTMTNACRQVGNV